MDQRWLPDGTTEQHESHAFASRRAAVVSAPQIKCCPLCHHRLGDPPIAIRAQRASRIDAPILIVGQGDYAVCYS